jgi:hypothetical protein
MNMTTIDSEVEIPSEQKRHARVGRLAVAAAVVAGGVVATTAVVVAQRDDSTPASVETTPSVAATAQDPLITRFGQQPNASQHDKVATTPGPIRRF